MSREKKRSHLKLAYAYLSVWLIVAYALFRSMKDLGGLGGLMGEVQDGRYSDLLLLAFSIVLLAAGLRHLVLHFSNRTGGQDRPHRQPPNTEDT